MIILLCLYNSRVKKVSMKTVGKNVVSKCFISVPVLPIQILLSQLTTTTEQFTLVEAEEVRAS